MIVLPKCRDMKAHRKPDDSPPYSLNPGDYCWHGEGECRLLWVRLPNGAGPSRLDGWTVVEHTDGTVTVSPSIHDLNSGWHGYLERDIWRQI